MGLKAPFAVKEREYSAGPPWKTRFTACGSSRLVSSTVGWAEARPREARRTRGVVNFMLMKTIVVD